MVVRAAAKRWIRDLPARIQPVRSPAQCDLLREPMVTTAGLKAASGAVADAVEVQLAQGLVHHQHRSGCGGGLNEPAALGVGHHPAGGVVEVRHHVGHLGALLHHGGFHAVHVPAVCRAGRATGTGRQPLARMASRACG